MTLQKQVVPVPFAQGLETKSDPKQVPLGKLLTLENGFFQTPMEMRKRYGFNALSQNILNADSPTDAIQSGEAIASYNNELLLYNASNSMTAAAPLAPVLYSRCQDQSSWNGVGYFQAAKLQIASVSVKTPDTSNVNQAYQDCVYDSTSDLECFIWKQSPSGGLHYAVVEKSTGLKILSAPIIGGTAFSKVVFFSGNFVVLFTDTSGNLSYVKFTASTIYATLISSLTIVVTNVNTSNPCFDASVIGTRLYLTYNYTTTGISTLYLDSTFTKSAEVHDTTHAATSAITVCGDGSNRVNIAYSNGSNVYFLIYDANLSSVKAVTLLAATGSINQIGIVWGGTGNDYIHAYYCAYTNHSINNFVKYATFTTAGVIQAGIVIQRSVSLASRPFVYNSRVFFIGLYGGTTTGQPTLFTFLTPNIVSNGYAIVVGKVAASEAFDNTRTCMLPTVSQISSGVWIVAYAQAAGGAEIAIWSSTWVLTIDFTVTPMFAEIANTVHATGGQLWMYDGQAVVEHSFHLAPEIVSVTASGSAGAFPATTTYEYVAVYEWVDANGQTHRSAPSLPMSVTTGGSGAASIAVVFSYLRVTNKGTLYFQFSDVVRISIYRTAGDGTIFYAATTALIANNQGADSATFTDSSADFAIIGNAQIYTTSGQVDNSSAPACLAITTYKSRLIVIPSDNPYSWWYSQEVIPNSASSSATPVELSEFFIQNIDQAGGPITGVAVMDDKLVLMKESNPYYVVGNGPSPNGSNNDYSPPQNVVCPVGLDSANAIVLTPSGLMFQSSSDGGIWLLDRGLGPSYIGADVEAYNGQTVTSAVLYSKYNQVRFTMSGGVVLVYDYYVKQWSVYTNIAAIQACLFQGSWTWVKSNGVVYQESASTFTDNGTFVQLKVGTSWMKFAGLQGFQRIYEALILGDYESAHSLVAKVYYDFDPTAAQTTTISPTSAAPYEWRLLFNRQKCQAMKIELYDTQISPAEGMRLSALSMLVGTKQGLNKLPAARTFE